jgi:ABC-type transport system substrate-binding protein
MVMPLFPLGVTYLPYTSPVLNIFEPRYRAMYNDILFSGARRFMVCNVDSETGRMAEVGVSLDPDVFFFNLRPAMWAKDPRRAWIFTDTFRKALNHAIDREAYANTVFLGAAVPVHGPVSPGNKTWFWPDLPRYAFDREKSSALLAELGLANRDADAFLEDAAGNEARFTLIHYKGNTAIERGAQVLKEGFERVDADTVTDKRGCRWQTRRS